MELSAKNFLWMLIFQWNLWFLIFQKYVKMRGSKNGTLIWWVNAISILLPASYDVIFSYTFPLWIMWFLKQFCDYDPAKFLSKKWWSKPPFFLGGFFGKLWKWSFSQKVGKYSLCPNEKRVKNGYIRFFHSKNSVWRCVFVQG